MGNGKKAKLNGIPQREIDTTPEPENITGPQNMVVVLTYTSEDGEIEEDFGKFVNDLKALYSFKQDVRAYALVEDAADRVLALVEKNGEGRRG